MGRRPYFDRRPRFFMERGRRPRLSIRELQPRRPRPDLYNQFFQRVSDIIYRDEPRNIEHISEITTRILSQISYPWPDIANGISETELKNEISLAKGQMNLQ